jgi:hypothetical protein
MSSTLIFAGIIAKGLGVIAAIFGFGLVVGIILTAMVMGRLRRRH